MPQLALAPSSGPAHVLVAHADGYPSVSGPLDLPVAASSHPGLTQHLCPAGEAVWVVRVGLRVGACGHGSLPVREAQVRVGSVRVQDYIVVIWTEDERVLQMTVFDGGMICK